MKTLKVIFLSLALAAATLTVSADDKSSNVHWYQVTLGQPYYAFVGSSTLSEVEMEAKLAKQDGFVQLTNLLYRDNNGKFKDWHEWDPTAQSRIFLNTKAVVSFQPLVGDPRKVPDSQTK